MIFFRKATVSSPHFAQTPWSRASTLRRTYPFALVLKHQSSTHASLQKVRRPFGTSTPHRRHRPRPSGPRWLGFQPGNSGFAVYRSKLTRVHSAAYTRWSGCDAARSRTRGTRSPTSRSCRSRTSGVDAERAHGTRRLRSPRAAGLGRSSGPVEEWVQTEVPVVADAGKRLDP